jgi:glycolate oxidase FAD binding subunit
MDLTVVAQAVVAADAVLPVGGRTHAEVGNPVHDAVEVAAPHGVVAYEPADLTVTVGAGTTCAALDALLAEHGQECALDPRDPNATVGGVLASGLSGWRRLRHGPVRDQVLEIRVVLADGRVVKGGGPTVKNVTGYDLPRLLVGSLGTLGLLVQVTLRCRPRAPVARWYTADTPPDALFRPSAVLWDGTRVHVLLEGVVTDVDAQADALRPGAQPARPDGAHRGRISVAPGAVQAVGRDLDALRPDPEHPGPVRWCAELGVGTIHVAGDTPAALDSARDVAHRHGGWLLREAGGDRLDGFGRPLPNRALMRRIKDALDPHAKFAPGRLPL